MSKCLKFCTGLKFKADFYSEMSDMNWAWAGEFNPLAPGNSNHGRHLAHRPQTPISIAPLWPGPYPHVYCPQLQIPGAAHDTTKTNTTWPRTLNINLTLKRTGGVRCRNVWNFAQRLNFKADFHSKTSVCGHEQGFETLNPRLWLKAQECCAI